MLLKAALNGSRTFQEHPNIPISAEQMANDVQSAISLGVGAIHIHPRNKDGLESLKWSDIEPVILAIRKSYPTIPVGISTGRWIVPDFSVRLQLVSHWKSIVNFASVNFHEEGAAEIASKLLELEIGVEAGLFHARAAEIFVQNGLDEKCLRIMFEPGDETISEALQTVDGIEEVLTSHKIQNKSRLLHGYNSTAWPLLREAKKRGYDTRIGFEDVLTLPDGRPAKSNGELIAAAQRIMRN